MKLSEIKPNPNNPRIIKDEKFAKLKKSIQEFPKMMELRPIVIDSGGVVLGGNMRFRALQDLGYKEIPKEWVKKANELTEDEKKRFIISDNSGFGEWDWDAIANEWSDLPISDWGLDVMWGGHSANDMELPDEAMNEDFDAYGTSKGLQRVVFIFDGKDEAESYLRRFPELNVQRFNNAWQVNLSTQSI
jgi:hypothetical protein